MNSYYLIQLVVFVVPTLLAIAVRAEGPVRNFDRDFLHFGKRAGSAEQAPDLELERHFMHFGRKRSDDFGRQSMPFGKRSAATLSDVVDAWPGMLHEKKSPEFHREFLHFGKKRSPSAIEENFERDFMAFGKKRAPGAQPFERDFLAFG